ncbi:MAG: hypothetical protein K0R10_1173, partial [Alphaproteobacteria bacterium]|nr:hypothetical protein [Alphaproteobacteria bacterium]
MRLFFISLLIALAVLSPEIAELQNWDMPGWALMVLRAVMFYSLSLVYQGRPTQQAWGCSPRSGFHM